MDLPTIFIIFVPISFGCIHLLEFTAIMARISGIETRSSMLGFTIQSAVYVGTRLFIVLLLPMLGLLVDLRISASAYQLMTIAALLAAALLSFIAFKLQRHIVVFYVAVIGRYKTSGNFAKAFFVRPEPHNRPKQNLRDTFALAWGNPDGRRIICQSMVVFAIYATGIFASFYVALENYEYRASISQLSGIVNSFGTVLLTFFIEPRISKGIDEKREDAVLLVQALLIGRLIGVALLSQCILISLFMVI